MIFFHASSVIRHMVDGPIKVQQWSLLLKGNSMRTHQVSIKEQDNQVIHAKNVTEHPKDYEMTRSPSAQVSKRELSQSVINSNVAM